jgi:hypothetical protein
MTGEQRTQLTAALGPEVVQVADHLQQALDGDGRADAALWRDLLQALYSANADVMETPLGQLFTLTVLARIQEAR